MLSNTALVILLWYEITAGENLMMCIYVLAFLRLCGLGLVCILNVAAACRACLLLLLFCGLVSSLQYDIYRCLLSVFSCYFFYYLAFLCSRVLALSHHRISVASYKASFTNTTLTILIWYHKADIIKVT